MSPRARFWITVLSAAMWFAVMAFIGYLVSEYLGSFRPQEAR